jgi:predicted NBD/HSP70 family sugar kinase
MTEAQTNDKQLNLIGLPSLNRQINASQVMNLIFREGTISRARLVKLTGIKANTISSIVQDFIDDGLIRKVGYAKSTGGRPPILYQIRPSGLHLIGIEVSHHELMGVLINLQGDVLASMTLSFPDTSMDTIILAIKSLVKTVCQDAGIPRYKINGVGVALPGIIDAREHRVVFSTLLEWENVEFGDKLSDVLRMDVRIVNNAVAGLVDAIFDKRQENCESILFYYLNFLDFHKDGNINIGCALALNGQAYLGRGHMAGEIHNRYEHPFTRAKKSLKPARFPNFEELLKRSLSDKTVRKDVWLPLAEQLGIEIARGIDMISPCDVVINSDLKELEALIGPALYEIIQKNSVVGNLQSHLKNKDGLFYPKISFRAHTQSTVARGSALPFIQELSNAPNIRGNNLL